MSPPTGLGAGDLGIFARSRGPQSCGKVLRKKRTIDRHAYDGFGFARVVRHPVQAGKDAGKRSGVTGDRVRNDRVAELLETLKVTVGVQDQPVALRL